LELTSLEEWLGHQPFESKLVADKLSVSIRRPAISEIVIPDQNLKVMFLSSISQQHGTKTLRLDYRAQIAIESPIDRSLDEWLTIAYDCQNLMTLLVGQPVAPREIALSPVHGDAGAPETVFYLAVNRAEKVKEVISWPLMMLPFSKINAGLPKIFTKWFAGVQELKQASSTFFSHIYSPPNVLELRYLNMTQALESFHRANYDGSALSRFISPRIWTRKRFDSTTGSLMILVDSQPRCRTSSASV
jgi:hypothetical protein